MSSNERMEGRITAFPVESIQPQEQANLPGEEAKVCRDEIAGLSAQMDPQPDYTRLEARQGCPRCR